MLLNNKRKFIVGGVVALTSVALISTGFATWAIAKDTTVSNVTTPGVVTVSGSMDLTVEFSTNAEEGYDGTLSFGPKDDGGLVSSTVEGGEEDLSITLVGTVEDYHACDSLEFVATAVDRGTGTGEKTTNNVNAASTYYTLPGAATISSVSAGNTVTTGDGVYNISENTATWKQTLTFGWGSAFENKNPSEYYEGSGFSGAQTVKSALETMNSALGNIEFLITVTAKVKTSTNA
jgi:hypothetical protein